MISHWILSDSKSSQVFWTILSILDDLNNAVVWMISTRPLIFKSFSPCTNPWVIVPREPFTIGIIVTLMFHSFFNSLAKVEALITLFTFFQFLSVSAGRAKSTILRVLFYSWLIIIRSGRLSEIWWSVCISKSQWCLCVSFSRIESGLLLLLLLLASS